MKTLTEYKKQKIKELRDKVPGLCMKSPIAMKIIEEHLLETIRETEERKDWEFHALLQKIKEKVSELDTKLKQEK